MIGRRHLHRLARADENGVHAFERRHFDKTFGDMHGVAFGPCRHGKGRAFDDGRDDRGFDAEMLLAALVDLEHQRAEILKDAGHAFIFDGGKGHAAVRADDD